ncbi:Hypothetical protein, putative [Bodo saltans]|uniref:Uncharacterized protein n=1 Tax=Bodo saltans TaxID=75058 RepID=A0A0S4IRS0_BODSA|nr:Hypothetical protein, putative [Bodo saltans]|eukprot:CUF52226.1 Hypothetical protein, putative [Bodo saltans]
MIICFCGGSGLKHFWRELFSLPTINPAHSQKEEASDNRPQWAVVVAMTDDGGSSRAIMDALGGLPVGDCRNVGLAVADGMHHALSQRVTTTVEDHEAASSLLLLDAVRWMHDLLSHRLCPEDAEVARDELMDVVSQLAHIICTTRAGSQKKEAHPQRLLAAHLAHTALLAFLAAVGVCRQAPFSPSDHLNESEGETSNFTFRNASVGNLVLSGLLLIELKRQRHLAEAEPYSTPSSTQLPLFSALKTFLDTLLCVDQMSVMLNFDISVIPTLDYHHQLTNTTSSRSSTATSFTHETPSVRCPPEDAATSLLCGGGPAKLPRVALEVEWADWTTTWGQRAVSYGGGGDDGGNDDPLVTKKASHHYPAAGGHDVDTAAAASSHRCSSTRGVPKRINVWQETSQRNGNHDRSIIRIVPSPVVTQLLSHGRCVIEETRRDNGEVLEQCAGVSSVMTINSQRSQQQQRRCVLARGSFLTSTLAAVAPHLSCLQPHNGCDERREATATDDNRTGWEPVSQCEPLAPLSSSSVTALAS